MACYNTFEELLTAINAGIATEAEILSSSCLTEEQAQTAWDAYYDALSATPTPIDYEYITTPAMCINDTWQYQIITKEDGVTTNTENFDTGISCDDPMPVDVEVIQKERCDTVTGTIWKQPVYYAPTDAEDATTTSEVAVGVEYDTGVSCESLLQDLDVTDCDGTVTTERAVPVAIKGTSSVKECNSDAILAQLTAQNQTLTDLLAETQSQGIQLDTVISNLTLAVTQLQAINANTDSVEQGLTDILADMQNLDRVDDTDYTQALADILAELQALDFDTTPIELLITQSNVLLQGINDEVDEVEELLTEIRDNQTGQDCTTPTHVTICDTPVKYETNRTAQCRLNATTGEHDVPKYLVAYSDGTTELIDPDAEEGNWCECN